jgi:hypothetical protein
MRVGYCLYGFKHMLLQLSSLNKQSGEHLEVLQQQQSLNKIESNPSPLHSVAGEQQNNRIALPTVVKSLFEFCPVTTIAMHPEDNMLDTCKTLFDL